MKKSIFIISKPLQLMVSEIIKSTHNHVLNELYIIDSFANSYNLADNVRKYGGWDKVALFSSKLKAFTRLFKRRDIESIYIDSDVGLKMLFLLAFFKVCTLFRGKIFVFEEGIGTYRDDIYKNYTKKKFYKIIGAGVHFGGCFYTDGIHVFNPIKYKLKVNSNKIAVYHLNCPLIEYIHSNNQRLNLYFDVDLDNLKLKENQKTMSLYMSSWTVDYKVMNIIRKNEKNCFYVKLHPHIKTTSYELYNICDRVLPSNIPMELLVLKLSEQTHTLTVYHHGSSMEHYINAKTNLNIEYVKV